MYQIGVIHNVVKIVIVVILVHTVTVTNSDNVNNRPLDLKCVQVLKNLKINKIILTYIKEFADNLYFYSIFCAMDNLLSL